MNKQDKESILRAVIFSIISLILCYFCLWLFIDIPIINENRTGFAIIPSIIMTNQWRIIYKLEVDE